MGPRVPAAFSAVNIAPEWPRHRGCSRPFFGRRNTEDVHAAKGPPEGGCDEVGVHFDRTATVEPASCDAGQEQLDAVVDLVEEAGPLRPGGLQRTQEGPNLGDVHQLAWIVVLAIDDERHLPYV